MKATYVSVWDGGTHIRTSCEYDRPTNTVSDIETADVRELDVCEDEFVELPDGTEIRNFNVEGQEAESLSTEEIEALKKIVKSL